MRVIQITSAGRAASSDGSRGFDSRGASMSIGMVESQPVVDVDPRDLRVIEITFIA